MANKKYTELPQANAITGAEILAMVQDGGSVQGDIDLIKAYFDTLYAPAVKYAKLSDTRAANTNGGGLSSGSWVTRTINTEDTDSDGIVSITSNQFTLQSGTYRIYVTAPAAFVFRHKIKLRNTTDSADTLIGQSEFASLSYEGHTISTLSGQFTIAGAKAFEIQHRVQITNGTNGGGIESNFGVSEVYTVVEIWKVA